MINSIKKFVLNDFYFPFLTAGVLCLIMFGPGLVRGQLPIATDILSGDYEPWMSLQIPNSTFPFPVKNAESFDTPRQYYPFRYQAIEQIKSGHLPLWNSTQLSGTPLAAEFITGAYYPLNIIFFLMPFVWAWGILAILQIYLAFITMYFFLSSEKLGKFSASFGSTVFALSGFMAGFFHANDMDQSVLWTPLGLFAINKLFKTKDIRWVILISISIGLIGLASHVQILLYSFLLIILYALFKGFSERKWRLLLWAFLGTLIGALLCGIQIIPTIEMIGQSARLNNYFGNLDQLLSPLYHLFLFISPNYFGNPGRLNYFGGPSYYHEYSFYIGISTLFFAAISLLQIISKKRILFWLSIFISTLILATINPISMIPINLHIPFWESITPTRAYAYTDIALAILGAIGLEYTLLQKNRRAVLVFVATASMITVSYIALYLNTKISGIFFLKYLFDESTKNAIAFKSLLQSLLVFGITSVLIFAYLLFKKGKGKYLLISLICAVTFFDLGRQFYFQNPFVPASSVFPKSKITDYLGREPLPPRVISINLNIIPPDVGGVYRLEHLDGYEANHSRKYGETFANYENLGQYKPNFAKGIALGDPTSPVIDLLGTDYLFYHFPMNVVTDDPHYQLTLHEGGVYVYQNDNSIPRFRLLAEKPENLNDLALMKTKKLIYPETGSMIVVERYEPGDINLNIHNSKSTQTLQTMITYYPGWRAIVNNKESEAAVSKDGFVSANVPSGDSKVRFVYKPQSTLYGIYLTVFGVLVLIAIFFGSKILNKKVLKNH